MERWSSDCEPSRDPASTNLLTARLQPNKLFLLCGVAGQLAQHLVGNGGGRGRAGEDGGRAGVRWRASERQGQFFLFSCPFSLSPLLSSLSVCKVLLHCTRQRTHRPLTTHTRLALSLSLFSRSVCDCSRRFRTVASSVRINPSMSRSCAIPAESLGRRRRPPAAAISGGGEGEKREKERERERGKEGTWEKEKGEKERDA